MTTSELPALTSTHRPTPTRTPTRIPTATPARVAAPTGIPTPAYRVALATDSADVEAAQRLRFTVFDTEYGASTPGPAGLDADQFDDRCDHLIVRHNGPADLAGAAGQVVATYRLLPPHANDFQPRAGGLYSNGEFDLSPLESILDRTVEAGRSCVAAEHRGGAPISLLWGGITRYLETTGYRYLLGCASVPLSDGGGNAAAFADLARSRHAAPEQWWCSPAVPFDTATVARPARPVIPPLLRGYLRLGAVICGPPCIDPTDAMASRLRQLVRGLALSAALVAGLLLVAAATSIPGYRRARRGPWAVRHAARWALGALGVRVVVHGEPRSGPSLVVGNHVSWLDILALAGCAPQLMVAKSEVRSWPLVGGAAVRAGAIFLQRNSLRSLPGTVELITAALRSGQRVQVFPEATTRCGGALGEFHRAAFQAAIDAAVVISPVTIAYAQDGRPGSTVTAFLGDESLLDSLRRVLVARRVAITVRWLTPIPAIAGTGRNHLDRATVTRLAENAVAASLAVPIVRRGHRAETVPPPATASRAAPSAPGAAGGVSPRRVRPVAPR